jgi:hypothetical protein
VTPAPRPAARVLLAGRFLAPRASLLALPGGPVAALDLSSGASVSLAVGPAGADPLELDERIERWNALALQGCPAVRELRWHLGRPLISSERHVGPPPRAPLAHERPLLVAQAVALGTALDAAGLGLPVGVADLAVGSTGICLRRPALWPSDPARPLAHALAGAAARLLDLVPEADHARAPAPWRARATAALCDLRSRRVRVALVLGVAVLAAVISSSLVGGSHGDASAHAAAVSVPVPAHRSAVVPARPARNHARVPRARPTSRGGPARVLLVVPRVPTHAHAPAPRRTVRVAPPPPSGWVAGLFVGQ